ncbi:MAG: aspartate aminotransferase family protein [Deltaproteobacteria bacterium]|nr:aspartate aminotransferase family protein [Deltaproteobacteria bacterium]
MSQWGAKALDRGSKADVLERAGQHLSSGKREFYRSVGLELVMGERQGVYFKDLDGRELFNAHCNGGVFNLGHRHPRIVAALVEAAQHLDLGNHHLLSATRSLLAERLCRSAPGDLAFAVFASGGGEAVDFAIKLARAHTRRPGIISAIGGYHGHTGLALATGDAQYKDPFEPLAPGFSQVPFDDLAALEAAITDETAAVILETVPATLGMPIAQPDYFREVRRLCDARGAQLIIDEVQTGLGRTGRMWGIDHYGVVPDLLLTAKGLGGGMYPIAATLYRPHLDAFMRQNPFIHISTGGGAELGCAVALEVLEVTEEPGFLETVRERAVQLQEGLTRLREEHSRIFVEVRQLGLMVGLAMSHPSFGPLLCRIAPEVGLFCVYANNDQRVLQFLIPLISTPSEVQEALGRLGMALSQLERLQGGRA